MRDSSLLIVHQGALGDLVLTFPAIIALRNKFNRIDMLCPRQQSRLAAHLKLIEKGYSLESACFATLFSEQIDPKIKDLICRYTAILAFSLSKDLKKSIRQATDSQCFQIPPRPPAPEKIHVTEFLMKHIMDCGLLEAVASKDQVFALNRNQTSSTDGSFNSAKIIIHPGAGSIRKRWPLAQFLKLAAVLAKRGLHPQFICGPAEPDLTAELQKQNQPVQNLIELTDLVDLLEAAGGYIGNDSGVSHLAAFLGLPSAVIFGPSDPVRWRPLGPRVEIVRPELDCTPCFEIEPENCARPACVADVSLESVLIAFDQVFKR